MGANWCSEEALLAETRRGERNVVELGWRSFRCSIVSLAHRNLLSHNAFPIVHKHLRTLGFGSHITVHIELWYLCITQTNNTCSAAVLGMVISHSLTSTCTCISTQSSPQF